MNSYLLNMNDYISDIEGLIRSCFIMSSYHLTTDRRTENIAFISGQIYFIEGSLLDFKEFVEKTDKGIEKYKYGYNYRKDSVVLFRYDNAPDPSAKSLTTFPHHKHTESGSIVDSHPVSLSEVLEEIEILILDHWEY